MGFDNVVVRVRGAAGEPVGAGMLLGPDLVATCAHVVADAAGCDPYAAAGPTGSVQVDFPMVQAGAAPVRDARVARWVPIEPDGSGDVAVLRLAEPAPAGARMPPLRRIDQLWDHPFRVLGFPEGLADGVWTTGRIRGRQATGWFQLQAAAGDQPIVGGFSGSPVWDERSGAVVGMTVAADRSGATTIAYLIPIDQVLGADPELLPCPYRGLEPFGEEHAEYFFGRDEGIARLEEVLARQPLVTLAGPSGAGKSSLVRAGLLPRARSRGATVVELRPLPGQPVDELVGSVPTTSDGNTLVLVDQFEEVVAADRAGATRLLAALADLLDAIEPRADGSWSLQVVLTARPSTLEEVLAPEFAARLGAGTVLLATMDRQQLRAAIVNPAERAPGLAFEPGLVDRILDDAAAEPGQLPLVESVLTELWERRAGGVLTIEAYERSGGVAGVVATRAEQVVGALGVPVDDPRLRRVFTAMAGTDRDGRFVRRPLRTADLDPALRPLVDQLVAGRLLVLERPPTGQDRVQLAHQALIEHWPRLRAWLAEDRDFVAWRDEAAAQRDRWEAAGRDDGALLRGVPLAATAEWLPRRAADVPAPLREFVSRSRAGQRREVRRWRVVTAVLAVLVLAAGALAAVAVARGEQINAQLRLLRAEAMAQTALDQLPGDPVTAAALASAAYRSDPASSTARTALARLALGTQAVDAVHTDVTAQPALVLTASDDGDTLMVRDAGQYVIVTGALGPSPAYWTLPGLPAMGTRVVLGPDGRTVAALAPDGRVLLWDVVRRGGPVVVSDGLGPALGTTLHHSPDGGRIAWTTSLPDGTRRLAVWDVRAAAPAPLELVPITDPQIQVVTLTADPGAVVEHRPSGLTVRAVADGSARATMPAGGVGSGSSPFYLTCAPGAAIVWDTATGRQLRRVQRLTEDCTEERLNRQLAANPEFIVEQRALVDERDLDLWRISSLRTGRAYELLAPPHHSDAEVQDLDPNLTAVTEVGERLVVHVLRQRAVLRLHADPADALGSARLTADGRYELATVAGGVHALEATSRAPAGELAPDELDGEHAPHSFRLNADSVGALTATPGHLSYAEYAVPGFARLGTWVLPGGPPSPGERIPPAVDSLGDRVAALRGGVLTGWDRRTGRPIGAEIVLATDAERTRHFGHPASITLRPGSAPQVAVMAPRGVELWNLETGARDAEFGSQPISVVFDDTGGRAAVVGRDHSVQVWDVDAGRPVGARVVTSATTVLIGFTADGLLASSVGTPDPVVGDRIVLLEPDTGRQHAVFTLPPDARSDAELTADRRLSLLASGGRRPSTFPLEAREWAEHLCRLVDRPFTEGERSLLPTGTDIDRPCGN